MTLKRRIKRIEEIVDPVSEQINVIMQYAGEECPLINGEREKCSVFKKKEEEAGGGQGGVMVVYLDCYGICPYKEDKPSHPDR